MKTDQPVTITGRAAVLVSKYTAFDLSDPGSTPAHQLVYVDPTYVKDGVLKKSWAGDGYRLIGWAEIKVDVMPVKSMLTSAVETLKAEKETVLAEAQKRATEIEGEIQKLLAITYDAEVQS